MVSAEGSRVDGQGRVVIPAGIRHALGVEPGDAVTVRLVDGEIRITTRRAALARARGVVTAATRGRRSLAGELIEERRAEATRG